MWEVVEPQFSRLPAQGKVAMNMINIGLSVRDGKVFCGPMEMSVSAMARALKVDRRIITNTVKTIESDPKLQSIFEALEPTCSLRRVAPVMGWTVVEIHLADSNQPGLLGRIASELGRVGVSIRQAVGEDPQYSEGRLYIIAESEIPAEAVISIRKIPGVIKVIL